MYNSSPRRHAKYTKNRQYNDSLYLYKETEITSMVVEGLKPLLSKLASN